MSGLVRKSHLRAAYEEGRADGLVHDARSPITKDRYRQWAYDAGHAEGKRDRARLKALVAEMVRDA